MDIHILPRYANLTRGPAIWSLGCSEGQEVYSIAMLLAQNGMLARALLLGTDCRPDAIRAARAGQFEVGALKGVPADMILRYFREEANHYVVRPELKERIAWRVGNCLAISEPGPWDMIFCRNLAIYLSPQSSSALWAGLENSLRPGGYLVTGKAERPLSCRYLSAVAPCVYKRDRG
jgi:chemotaxis methyl-accepting protein methylase